MPLVLTAHFGLKTILNMFDGAEYNPPRDYKRLMSQINRIRDLMSDGSWRTLPEIAQATGDPPASISAQLRNLRKPKFGAWTIERRYVSGGLFEYRLVKEPAYK